MKNMDKHAKKCVFRPSRCEYCGAETAFNRLQVSWHTHPYSEWVTLCIMCIICVCDIDIYTVM